MAKQAKPAKAAPSPQINPGQSQKFLYLGDFIPFEVAVKNLGPTVGKFRLRSTSPGWTYYGRIAARGRTTLSVEFPSGKLTVYNDGQKPIEVVGNGVRPA